MNHPEPQVTVVIPNWNGLAHLEECLTSLRAQRFNRFRVVVVDNASTDGSVAWLRQNAPEVQVITMPKNGGFAYAVNEGIRHATGEYVALLNNDTHADPGWLEALVDALKKHPGFDTAASCMLVYDQPELANAAGDIFWFTRLEARHRGFFRPARHYQTSRRVFGACAGAALYRRSLFEDIGLFDEEYFLMSEDTDFNVRALLAGHECLYVPDAVVSHKIMGTIRTQPQEKMQAMARRNQIVVVVKNFPGPVAVLAFLFWPWRIFRQTLPVRPRNLPQIPALLRQAPAAVRSDIEGVRMGLRRRRETHPVRRISRISLLRWLMFGIGSVDPEDGLPP